MNRFLKLNINNILKRKHNVIISSRYLSSLPSHTVVPFPALSPTMEVGTISKWNLKEGDKFEPGVAICEVETDKATVTYDATEEGYIAKILVGSGEIKVGQPIFIQVDDEADIKAFSNYQVAATVSTPAPTTPKKETPDIKSQPPVQSPVQQPVQVKTESQPTKPVNNNSSNNNNSNKSLQVPIDIVHFVRYGTGVKKSALYSKLAEDQKKYIDKYGRSGHKVI